MSELISQKNIMSDIIAENRIHLSDKFLLELMTSTLSRTQITDGIITYHLDKVKFPMITFIITYKNYSSLESILTNEGISEVRASLKEFFAQSFRQADYFKILDIDQHSFVAITSYDKFDALIQKLKQIVLNISLMLDIDLLIFTGTPANSWYDISDSYMSAFNIKEKNIVFSSKNTVVFTADYKDNVTIKYSTDMENELIMHTLSGDTKTAIKCIDNIIDVNMKSSLLPHDQYAQLIIMLYSTITKLLTSINKTEKELFDTTRIYLELISCHDTKTLKSKLSSFICTIISNITAVQQQIEDDDTKRILKYVQENYNKDISLFTLSDYLNVSQSYASKLFKSHTGENFKDYIATVRLNKALEIMSENPNMRLNTIAHTVGYSNDTFTRVFTKKFGMTPSHYIKTLSFNKKEE